MPLPDRLLVRFTPTRVGKPPDFRSFVSRRLQLPRCLFPFVEGGLDGHRPGIVRWTFMKRRDAVPDRPVRIELREEAQSCSQGHPATSSGRGHLSALG